MAGKKAIPKKVISEITPATVEVKKEKSQEEIENLIEEYLGVHPRYFIYSGMQIHVDIWTLEHDGKHFNGFLPNMKKLGQI